MPSSDDDITPLPPAPDPQVRTLPCQRRAWCVLAEHDDETNCVEVPRERREVTDPLPQLRSPSFTAQLRKANSR
jgi:hypothetical protein